MSILIGIAIGILMPGYWTETSVSIGDLLFEILITPFFTTVGIVTYLHLTGRGPKKEEKEIVEEKQNEPIPVAAA